MFLHLREPGYRRNRPGDAVYPRAFTYHELMATPEDGLRREILDGEWIASGVPGVDHQAVVGNLLVALHDAAEATDAGWVVLGPLDIKLADYAVVSPDLLFVRRERVSSLLKRTGVFGAPDIMVEILSPYCPADIDTVRKRELYERYGVAEYWIVDPMTRSSLVLTLVAGRYEPLADVEDGWIRSRVLPGLAVEPAAVFEGMLVDLLSADQLAAADA